MSDSKSGLKIIDWDEAMNQVGGDDNFLDEVLQDLLTESKQAEIEIGQGIKDKDYNIIMKAAHRIKGSASYLCCEQLKDISLQLQDTARDGIDNPSDKLLDIIEGMYTKYQTSLAALRNAIKNKK
mmetsp:Transcript_2205/g.1972  ORF Transcript_2205/g.1972 Transcript_2205/m.1972 type:complete len:125 (-) Transcript_2205:93-467(-)